MERYHAQANVRATLRGFSGTNPKLTNPRLRQLANHPDILAITAYRDIAVKGTPAFGRGPQFTDERLRGAPPPR